jgi:RNA polymerase sigma factor (sigma-70 family)
LLRLQSDERLIAMVRRGQPAAFETLVSRYQSRLLSFCRHMLGSREDAEDVLQEVFAAAFNAILADEREINVRPWLYRIARNRSLNHLRRASAIGVDSMDVHFAEGGISTAEKVMRRESFRQLIGDVQQLAETQRTALLLREIDALSYEQIADAMETTVPAVKSLLVRARISLAEAAEARKLTCEEVRLELGEAAEGLLKSTPATRRHVRDCERCRAFRKQLKSNNVALAAILPVGPLLMLKKLVLTKLGSTAGAGGAHVAGAGGAGAAAGASAAGGASAGGGLLTAGASALATKAVAGLAVAAIVTASTVAADHAASPSPHHHHHALAVAATATSSTAPYTGEPVVTRSSAQPVTVSAHNSFAGPPAKGRSARHLTKKARIAVPKPATAQDTTENTTPAGSGAAAVAVKPVLPKPVAAPVTEVTTETTQLPSTQTTPGEPAGPAEVTTTSTTPTPTQPPVTTTSTTTTTETTVQTPPPAPEETNPPAVGIVVSNAPQPTTQGSEEPVTQGPEDTSTEDSR